MSEVRTNPAPNAAEQELAEILQEFDDYAEAEQSRWAEKRTSERRRFRTACRIIHRKADGVAFLVTPGKTRDLSAGGVSFLSREHYLLRASLVVTVTVPGGKTRHLVGKVAYSRFIRHGWYLTGLKSSPIEDDGLTLRAKRETSDPPPSSQKVKSPARAKTQPTSREKSLALLAAASASRMNSKDKIDKVVALSMSPDHVVRRATIPVLLGIPRQQAVMVLTQLLSDPNAEIRGDAADALGQLTAKESAPDLSRLLRDENVELALRAAEALGRMGDRSGLTLATKWLKSDNSLNRRAARAVGVILDQDFRPNSQGVIDARRYLAATAAK